MDGGIRRFGDARPAARWCNGSTPTPVAGGHGSNLWRALSTSHNTTSPVTVEAIGGYGLAGEKVSEAVTFSE